jgi:hypothetical protein
VGGEAAYQRARLHVVEGILEHASDHARDGGVLARRRQLLQGLEQVVVHEVEERVARDALGVLGPRAPPKPSWDRRPVVVLEHLLLGFVVVEDFEEDHPDELTDALGVAVDAGVLAHDVLDGLDRGADGHGCSVVPRMR